MQTGASKTNGGNRNPQEVVKRRRPQVVCFHVHDHGVVFDLSHVVFRKPQCLPVGTTRLIEQSKVVGIKHSPLGIRMVELYPRVIPKAFWSRHAYYHTLPCAVEPV